MSGEFQRVEARAAVATQDMRTKQYRALRASAAGECQIASNAVLAPGEIIGVLQNKPNSGQNATVGYAGVSKVYCGSTVTANRMITIQASGQATNAASGDYAFGFALGAGVSGEVVSALLFQPALQLTTNSFSA